MVALEPADAAAEAVEVAEALEVAEAVVLSESKTGRRGR